MGSGCGPGWEGAAPHKGLTSLESGSAQAGVWAGSRACPWLAPRSTPPLPHSLAPQLRPRRFAVSRLARGLREGVSVGVCLASVCVTHHAHTFTRQSHARPCTPALGFVGPATLPRLRVGGGRCVCVPSTCGTVSSPSLRSSTLAFYATLT